MVMGNYFYLTLRSVTMWLSKFQKHQHFFSPLSTFVLVSSFPIRNSHLRSRNNASVLNPTGRSTPRYSNEHKLKFKENGFKKIIRGETTPSKHLNQLPESPKVFSCSETLCKGKENVNKQIFLQNYRLIFRRMENPNYQKK